MLITVFLIGFFLGVLSAQLVASVIEYLSLLLEVIKISPVRAINKSNCNNTEEEHNKIGFCIEETEETEEE